MKKIILILILSLSSILYSQDNISDMGVSYVPTQSIMFNSNSPLQKVNLNLQNGKNILDNGRNVRVGPVMLLGGASFIVAGLLTTPVYVGGSTTEKKPFFQQGGKMLSILSGCLVMTVGVGVSLGGY